MTHKFWACSSNAACVIPLTMWAQKEIYLENNKGCGYMAGNWSRFSKH